MWLNVLEKYVRMKWQKSPDNNTVYNDVNELF